MTGRDQEPATGRRVPQQVRSKDRYERILEVTESLVLDGGVESVNTRAIATAADIPVASLYQYFAHKDQILVSLMQRYLDDLDAQVREDVAGLPVLTVRSLVEAVLRAFVKVYLRSPGFVVIWVRGRTSPVIEQFCREHNRRLAAELFQTARAAGMTREGATGEHAVLAVEVTDRLFQVAFENSLEGNEHVIDETIDMVTAYLESHATPQGITGTEA